MHDKKFQDLTNKKFGEWTVLSLVKDKFPHRWFCQCSCGEKRNVLGGNLRAGYSRGCGHNKTTTKTHGMCGTRQYRCYRNMVNRCYNKNVKEYKFYGLRGISVCDKWKTFDGFWEDMKDEYLSNLTLDRINVNGNYCKENCRWITQIEQVNNTRNNKILELNGVKDTLPNWARRVGIPIRTLASRIYLYRWDDKKALTTPVNVLKSSIYRSKHQ